MWRTKSKKAMKELTSILTICLSKRHSNVGVYKGALWLIIGVSLSLLFIKDKLGYVASLSLGGQSNRKTPSSNIGWKIISPEEASAVTAFCSWSAILDINLSPINFLLSLFFLQAKFCISNPSPTCSISILPCSLLNFYFSKQHSRGR